MKSPVKTIVLASLCLWAGTAYAGVSMHTADIQAERPPDPKKKKAGEECKTSSDCQRHHTCSESGGKNVCTAPAVHYPSSIPNT